MNDFIENHIKNNEIFDKILDHCEQFHIDLSDSEFVDEAKKDAFASKLMLIKDLICHLDYASCSAYKCIHDCVEKMFNNFTLDMFKKDLSDMLKKDLVVICKIITAVGAAIDVNSELLRIIKIHTHLRYFHFNNSSRKAVDLLNKVIEDNYSDSEFYYSYGLTKYYFSHHYFLDSFFNFSGG